MILLTRYADVVAVLADPRFVPPPVTAGAPGGVSWLRASVARFSTGTHHERRRSLVTGLLRRIDPAALARQARLRPVPVEVLAIALGAEAPVAAAEAVAVVDRVYLSGGADPAADAAVARLVELLGGTRDEETANRIGLLVQAYAATAGLIARAARRAGPVAAVLDETLRHDPPVRQTRRLVTAPARIGDAAVAAGTLVHLDLAAANRDPDVFADPDVFDPGRANRAAHLTFGAGLRPCPGREHALALAAGALAADIPADPDLQRLV
jgi:cytochrome P450